VNYQCYFCQQQIYGSSCLHCSFSGLEVITGYNWVEFIIIPHVIDWYFNDSFCKIYINHYKPKQADVIELDSLPALNPKNIKDWLDRIIKMRVFL
jgi:hypothetical protein